MSGLTKGQHSGLLKIQFSKGHIIVMGPAGTGKTYLLRSFLETVNLASCAFCAPTHAAKQVLEDTINSGRLEHERIQAHTIHSLLKIHPETYEDQIVFDPNGEIPDLSNIKYMIVDEVSMVDGLLFGRIMTVASKFNFKVIGLGDPYQLQPVKPDGCYLHETLGIISPMFFHKDFERVLLDEIVRQSKGSPIIEVATKIRKENYNIFDCRSPDDTEIGVFKHRTPMSILNKYLSYVKTPRDTLDYKLMAYTNKTVDNLNEYIRRKLFDTDCPVVVGEYLVMQEPVFTEFAGQEMIIYHNGQACEVMNIQSNEEMEEKVTLPNMVYQGYIEGEVDEWGMDAYGTIEVQPINLRFWRVDLRSVDNDIEHTIDVIKDEDSQIRLKEYLDTAASIYKGEGKEIENSSLKPYQKKLKKKLLWVKYWEMKKRFVNTKGSAACTIHKTQGSTFIGAFIFTNKLNDAEYHLRRQLRYVATTRARKFVDFV